MDRWRVFEMLKGNIESDIALIESMPPEEVKEAVIEYLLEVEHEKN